jgi:hypothetical protein
MFVRETLTVWSEALKAVLGTEAEPSDYTGDLKGLPVHTDYPMARVDYPGIWLNYSMQGDFKNVGIGHFEEVLDDDGEPHHVSRWHFGGLVEFTLSAMGNLERAALVDDFSRMIAVSANKDTPENVFRETIEQNEHIGQIVTWDSYTIGAFGESQGTPWGTDDVIYEATIALTTSGEVVVDPNTGALVRLSAILTEVAIEGAAVMPTPGTGGWM